MAGKLVRGLDQMYVDVKGTLHHMTDKAILFSEDGERKVWLPKSRTQIDYLSNNGGQLVEITIPEWLALEKGLI